jgi:hypothetical protein
MNTLSLQFLTFTALFAISSSALAQSNFNPWAGPYAQIGIIGYESYIPKNASGTTSMGGDFPNTTTSNHANGPVANIAIGYNFEIKDQFLLGVGAALYPGHSRSASSVTTTGPFESHATYDVSNVFSFSLLPSYAFDESHLAYIKIGYAGSTVNANSADYSQQTTRVSGMVYGAGYKQMITESIYGFLEGNYAINKAKPVTAQAFSGAIVSSTLNATGYDFLIGVGYRF